MNLCFRQIVSVLLLLATVSATAALPVVHDLDCHEAVCVVCTLSENDQQLVDSDPGPATSLAIVVALPDATLQPHTWHQPSASARGPPASN
ncbi:MAG: hypothetical protein KJO55_10220 [Gammaproteobacteria bacterium]|nr:hypothetical protein [Gammaproteobacteria bacterium]